MQNKNYRETWGINQSAIKDFRFKSPRRWKSIWIDKQFDGDKNEDAFTFGSLVDTLLFTPHELEERFFVGSQTLPSDAIEGIIRATYNRIKSINENIEANVDPIFEDPEFIELNLETSGEILLDCANNYEDKTGKKGWNNGWKPETRLTKLIEQGTEYFKSLVKCNGRKIISQEMNFEAIEIKNILLSNEDVKRYFSTEDGTELFFQHEVFLDYTFEDGTSIPVKGAFDILMIDHTHKEIQMIDFKTSMNAFEFLSSIRKYGYATQLSYYDSLLRIWLRDYCNGIYCDYIIINPINIVIDKYDKIPYIYEYDWNTLTLERIGNAQYLFDLYQTNDHNSRVKKGWEEILSEIAWHYTTGFWNVPRELYENKKIKVNLNS